MRIIDADALKKDVARLHVLNDEAEIRRAYEYNPHATSTDFEETLVSVFDAIDDAPSIDIVRCKECKHNYNTAINHGKMQPRCDFTDYKLTENDYCSRGEREGE